MNNIFKFITFFTLLGTLTNGFCGSIEDEMKAHEQARLLQKQKIDNWQQHIDNDSTKISCILNLPNDPRDYEVIFVFIDNQVIWDSVALRHDIVPVKYIKNKNIISFQNNFDMTFDHRAVTVYEIDTIRRVLFVKSTRQDKKNDVLYRQGNCNVNQDNMKLF